MTRVDRSLGAALETARACLLDHVGTRDGHNAAALLGRLIASRGGSVSFASSEIDMVASLVSAAELLVLRASLLEGYLQAVGESGAAERDAAWEPPACLVPLGDGRVAIAGGFPNESSDAVIAWADRVASSVARSKFTLAVITGSPAAREALRDALSLVGVGVLDA